MLRDLKCFLLIWKIVGLQPMQNILHNDHTRWKVEIRNTQTFFIISWRLCCLSMYLRGLLRFKKLLISELILLALNVPFELTQYMCCRKLIGILSQLAEFDSRELFFGQPRRRTRRRGYLWSTLLVLFVLAYIFLATYFHGSTVNSKEILLWFVYVPLFFGRVSVPLSYMFVCTELSYRFVALRKSCKLLGQNMSAAENMFLIRPWSEYYSQILATRKAYSFLCDLADDLRNSFDLPISLFMANALLEVSWYFYNLVATGNHHAYRLVRCSLCLFLMYGLMERMDNLAETVSRCMQHSR